MIKRAKRHQHNIVTAVRFRLLSHTGILNAVCIVYVYVFGRTKLIIANPKGGSRRTAHEGAVRIFNPALVKQCRPCDNRLVRDLS
jgi:hypothetical protein